MLRIESVAAFLAVVSSAAGAAASITITIDRLDPSDGGAQPPAGTVIIDVLVDLSDEDAWRSGGIHARTFNGATFQYAWESDPENPNWPAHPLLLDPGTEQRFATFISQPRPRDGDERFTDGGVTTPGRFCFGGAVPVLQPTQFDVNFVASPPATADSPSVDGAIVRIALDVTRVCGGQAARVFHVNESPPGYVPLLLSECDGYFNAGTASATFDEHWLTGASWGVYVLHELADCPGDIDCDSSVDLADLTILLASFGFCQNDWETLYIPRADIDADGCIGIEDLSLLLAAFGGECP
jgi:hypothetical protein